MCNVPCEICGDYEECMLRVIREDLINEIELLDYYPPSEEDTNYENEN